MKPKSCGIMLTRITTSGILVVLYCQSARAETCVTNPAGGPDICVDFGLGNPTLNVDFGVDFQTDPAFPNVDLRTGNNAWQIWSVDANNPNSIGDIGIITSPKPDDFVVKIEDDLGGPGARTVKGIILDPTSASNFSNISDGQITGNLDGDLRLQKSDANAGGEVNLAVDGNVTGTIDVAIIKSDSALTIGGDVSGSVTCVDVEGPLTIQGSVLSTATIDIPGTITGEVFGIGGQLRIEDDVENGAIITLANMNNGGTHVVLGTFSWNEFDGQLILQSGVPVGSAIHVTGVLGPNGVIDVGPSGISGFISLFGGGSGIFNGGNVHPGGVPVLAQGALPFSGTATFASVSSTIFVISSPMDGTIRVTGNLDGGIQLAGSEATIGPNALIQVDGDLNGSIGIQADVRGDILISGSVNTGASISVNESPGDADIFGDIAISGHLQSGADISIDGGLNGSLNVGGDLSGSFTAVRLGVGGFLSVGGDVTSDGTITVTSVLPTSILSFSNNMAGTVDIVKMDGSLSVNQDLSGTITVTASVAPGFAFPAALWVGRNVNPGAVIDINNISGPASLQFGFGGAMGEHQYAGALILGGGLQTDQNLEFWGSLNAPGYLDLNGQGVTGHIDILGGGTGDIINGGIVTNFGAVELAFDTTEYRGTATFSCVEATGQIVTDNCSDLGADGTIHITGSMDGYIGVSGSMNDQSAILVDGEISGNVEAAVCSQSIAEGDIIADADGIGGGIISGSVTVENEFSGNICAENLLAGNALPPNVNINFGTGGTICDAAPCIVAAAPTLLAGQEGYKKNRHVSIDPENAGANVALRWRLTESTLFPFFVGLSWWAGAPQEYCENSGQRFPPVGGCGPAPGLPSLTYWGSQTQCFASFHDWVAEIGSGAALHTYGTDIVPDATYEVQAILPECNLNTSRTILLHCPSKTAFGATWSACSTRQPMNTRPLTASSGS